MSTPSSSTTTRTRRLRKKRRRRSLVGRARPEDVPDEYTFAFERLGADANAFRHEQDPALDSAAAVAARVALRSRDAVVAELERFWGLVRHDSDGLLHFTEYLRLCTAMERVLAASSATGYDAMAVMRRAFDDWTRDVHRDDADDAPYVPSAPSSPRASATAPASPRTADRLASRVRWDVAIAKLRALVRLGHGSRPSSACTPRTQRRRRRRRRSETRARSRGRSRGGVRPVGMSKRQFCDAVFEVADQWTLTLEEDDYTAFLRALHARLLLRTGRGVADCAEGGSADRGNHHSNSTKKSKRRTQRLTTQQRQSLLRGSSEAQLEAALTEHDHHEEEQEASRLRQTLRRLPERLTVASIVSDHSREDLRLVGRRRKNSVFERKEAPEETHMSPEAQRLRRLISARKIQRFYRRQRSERAAAAVIPMAATWGGFAAVQPPQEKEEEKKKEEKREGEPVLLALPSNKPHSRTTPPQSPSQLRPVSIGRRRAPPAQQLSPAPLFTRTAAVTSPKKVNVQAAPPTVEVRAQLRRVQNDQGVYNLPKGSPLYMTAVEGSVEENQANLVLDLGLRSSSLLPDITKPNPAAAASGGSGGGGGGHGKKTKKKKRRKRRRKKTTAGAVLSRLGGSSSDIASGTDPALVRMINRLVAAEGSISLEVDEADKKADEEMKMELARRQLRKRENERLGHRVTDVPVVTLLGSASAKTFRAGRKVLGTTSLLQHRQRLHTKSTTALPTRPRPRASAHSKSHAELPTHERRERAVPNMAESVTVKSITK